MLDGQRGLCEGRTPSRHAPSATRPWLCCYRARAQGRISWELPFVLPDRKTAYAGDDGTGVGFMKYVATTPGDLTAGTLSCAAYTQTSAPSVQARPHPPLSHTLPTLQIIGCHALIRLQNPQGGMFNINWINLGTLSDSQVEVRA